MLKKLFILNLFLTALLGGAVDVFAADPWGVFDDYDNSAYKYALNKVMNNIPIKYAITINSDDTLSVNPNKTGSKEETLRQELNASLNQEQDLANLQGLIKASFNAWLKDTKNMIAQSGRTQEFADIMPILSKQVILNKTNDKAQADIVFIFTTEKEVLNICEEDHPACIEIPDEEQVEVFFKTSWLKDPKRQKDLKSTLIHELGHYFALVDQYDDFGDYSPRYGTNDRFYKYDSIMAASYETSLGCDDVDGFINLIDITLQNKAGTTQATRNKKGWASFCNGKKDGDGELFKEIYYKNGRQLNRPEYSRNGNTYSYDAEGFLKNISIPHAPLFNFYDAGLIYDNDGVLIAAKTERFVYNYDWNSHTQEMKIYFSDNKTNNFQIYKLMRHLKAPIWIAYTDEQMFKISFDAEDNCKIEESFRDLGVEDNFTSLFNAGNKLKTYKHTRKLPKEKRLLDSFSIQITPNDLCVVSYQDNKIVSFNMTEERNNTIASTNEQELSNLSLQIELNKEQILDEMENLCYDTFINSRIYEGTCQYFRHLEDLIGE